MDAFGHLVRDRLEASDKREAGAIGDEAAWMQGGLDPPLDGIGRLGRLAAHRSARVEPLLVFAAASVRTAWKPESSPR